MKIFQKIITIICVLIIVWFAISWIEILCKNLSDANYSVWNIFNIFVNN